MAGVVAPLVMGWLTPTVCIRAAFLLMSTVGVSQLLQGSSGEWHLVFCVTCAILLSGAALFCLLASGDVEPFARTTSGADAKLTMIPLVDRRLNDDEKIDFADAPPREDEKLALS